MEQMTKETRNPKERVCHLERQTKETFISVELNIDGNGIVDVSTGVAFFDHMLDTFGRHGLFDLSVYAQGDIEVDDHHVVEDIGIVLGKAFNEALGERRGINRFSSKCIAMDEALVLSAIDISGRGQFFGGLDLPFGKVGNFDTQLPQEFFIALSTNANLTLHVKKISGVNAHHIIEASFKALGKSLCEACSINQRMIDQLPSTKGTI